MFDLAISGLDNDGMNETPLGRLLRTSATGIRRTRAGVMLCVLSASATIIASPTVKSNAGAEKAGAAKHRWYQVGRASWYGRQFQGRKTASGERFDMNALTCAHRSLPLGSWIRVTNLVNHRTTFVRVTDRGPIVASRVLDLSYAAAQKLGFMGTSEVKIEPVQANDSNMANALVAQILQTERSPFVAAR